MILESGLDHKICSSPMDVTNFTIYESCIRDLGNKLVGFL